MATQEICRMKIEAVSELWEFAGGDAKFKVHDPIEADIELLPSPRGVKRVVYVAITEFPMFEGLPAALTRCNEYGHVEPNCLGEGIRDQVREIGDRLYQALTQFADLLMWRGEGGYGPRDQFAELESYIEVDGDWLYYEKPLYLRRQWSAPSHFGTEFALILQGLIDDHRREPVGRALWREAWQLRHSNPRGAHILSVAAFEVGIKECISRLVPETEWLLDNTMVPSALQLAFDYLPQVLADRGELNAYSPPKEYRKAVQTAIEDRNRFVHRFGHSAGYQKALDRLGFPAIESTLLMFSDLLRLFDVYCGESWAYVSVRAETKQLLINRNRHRALPDLP